MVLVELWSIQIYNLYFQEYGEAIRDLISLLKTWKKPLSNQITWFKVWKSFLEKHWQIVKFR